MKFTDAQAQDIGLTPPPGIYLNVPAARYQAWPYLSKSGLSDFATSPALWYGRQTGAIPRKTSTGFVLGSATNLLWMEHGQLTLPHGWQIIPTTNPMTGKAMPKSGGVRQAYLDSLPKGTEAITAATAHKAYSMRVSLDANARARELLDGAHVEVSIVWDCPYTGLRLKGRADLVNLVQLILGDLKTTKDIRLWAFDRDASSYNYHWQLHLYTQGLAANGAGDYEAWRHWLVTVGNELPHGVACRPMGIDALELARDEVTDLLYRWQDCRNNNHWPADLLEEKPIELPRWRYKYTPQWRMTA